MKFYHRVSELELLTKLEKQSKQNSKMAVILGKRRIGKTSLALESVKNQRFVYLFIAKKSETLLCEQFSKEIERVLDVQLIGKLETFKDIFAWLIHYAKENPITVIIDEFQEFYAINPSVYSDIQCIWDLNKATSKMRLLFIGSIYPLMSKIFENQKEPLFRRADNIIKLNPFSISQIQNILQDNSINDLKNLFEFYLLTGGMPKYLDLLITNQCHNLDSCLDYMLSKDSPFLNEGRNQLIEEFGGNYATYFSILELISRGKTSSSEIESILQKNVSAYLANLEKVYNIITSFKPIDAKPNSRLQKYFINDNFLQFCFHYFHNNRDAIEMQNFNYIKQQIESSISTYSGRILERFFVAILKESQQYNRIGSYWERGHKNEIDIVAINDAEKRILLAEVKMNAKRNSIDRLEHRAIKLLRQYHDYEVSYQLLSLEDAKSLLAQLN